MRIFSWQRLRVPRPRLLLPILFLLGVQELPPLSVAELAGQFPGELRGRVMDAASGQAVAGAAVRVDGVPGTVRTDGDGSFRVRGLEAGPVRLAATAPGYRPEEATVAVRHGTVARVTLHLQPRIVDLEGLEVTVLRREGFRLDAEEVARSGARTVGELLEGLPGVVIRRRGPGGSEEVSLRGAGGDQVLVLLNGTPLNDPVTGTADLSLVPLTGVRAVEVLPGARSARHGPGALGGVIRIETSGGEAATHAALRAGSLGERGASLGVGGSRGELEGDVSLQLRHLDGAFAFSREDVFGEGEGRRTNADLSQGSVEASLSGPLGDEGRWRVRGGGGGVSRGIPGKAFAPSDSARQSQERWFVQARWEGKPGGLPLDVVTHLLDQEVRFRDPAPPVGPPFDSRAWLRSRGIEAEVPAVTGFADRLRTGGGLSVRDQAVTSDRFEGDGRVGRVDLGAFVHGEIHDLPLPGAPVLGAAVRAHRDGISGEWLPAHDVTLRFPLGALHLHAAHRSAFSPPSPGDQFFQEGVGIAPNPDLRAERVPGEVEAGASLRFRAAGVDGRLEAEAFRGDIRDMIVWAPDFRFVWSPRNVDVRRRGGEVRLNLRHPSSGLRAGGHWSHVRVTYDRGDASRVQVIYRPRDAGSLHLGWDRNPLRAELRARYTGERFPVPAPVNALEPFWTVDAVVSAEWRVRGWEVRPLVRVDRLLDERAPFIFAFPEPGRTFLVELRVRP